MVWGRDGPPMAKSHEISEKTEFFSNCLQVNCRRLQNVCRLHNQHQSTSQKIPRTPLRHPCLINRVDAICIFDSHIFFPAAVARRDAEWTFHLFSFGKLLDFQTKKRKNFIHHQFLFHRLACCVCTFGIFSREKRTHRVD